MQRVVVTGLGIVSSIGNGTDEVIASLRQGRCGMVYVPEMEALGYRCCVFAPVSPPEIAPIPPRLRRFISPPSLYAWCAATQAAEDAGLAANDLTSPRAGVVFGTCFSGRCEYRPSRGRQGRLDDPGFALRMLTSSPAAVLAHTFHTQGCTVSLSAACATGLCNIGHAFELLRHGALDVCLTGSAEGEVWQVVGLSGDNSSGMPVDWNDRPTQSCRPFDRDRQGFVMSAGSGALVLETLDHARRRKASIHAEVVGYGAANDGRDMFSASGEGLAMAISEAMSTAADCGVARIDYINAHGTGTIGGDAVEAQLIARLFGEGPLVSSTKGQAGHAQGGTASQEAVFTALMLSHDFVAPTANLEHVAPECGGIRHVQRLLETPLKTAMTINSGLGGTNACLILRKCGENG